MAGARSDCLALLVPGTIGTGNCLVYTCPAGKVVLVKWLTWWQSGGSGGAIEWYHTRSGLSVYWTNAIAVATGAAGAGRVQVYGVLEPGDLLQCAVSSVARGFWVLGVYGSVLEQ